MNLINTSLLYLKKKAGSDKGSVMIIALLVLLLISLIVFAAGRTTNVDLKIATNKKMYERSFYLAEGLTAQAVKILENTRDNDVEDLKTPLASGWPGGLVRQSSLANSTSVTAADWTDGVIQTWPNSTAWSGGNPQSATDSFRYIMVDEGIVGGGSLSLSDSRVYEYNIRGRAESGGGDVEISIGYKMRF